MSYKSSSDFNGIVYSGDIKRASCLLDYINGKAQFYVENQYYTPFEQRAPKSGVLKKPFFDIDYKDSKTGGEQLHAPYIFYHQKADKYFRSFEICCAENKLTSVKRFFMLNPFGLVNDAGVPQKAPDNGKSLQSFKIPFTSISPYAESPDDQALAKWAFDMTEVLSILTHAYIFQVDLANEKYKSIIDNISFYKAFAEDINAYLSKKKIEQKVEIDEDMVAHYSEDISYIPDPDATSKLFPPVPAYFDEDTNDYEVLSTIQTFIKNFVDEAKKRKVQPRNYLEGARLSLFTNIIGKTNPTNKINLKQSRADDGTYTGRFTINSIINIVGEKATEEEIKKRSFAYTCIFTDDDTWTPIAKQEDLMAYYRQSISGDVYIKPSFKIGLFAQVSYGLFVDVSKLDVRIIPKKTYDNSGATAIAKARREARGKVDAIAAPINVSDFDNISIDED